MRKSRKDQYQSKKGWKEYLKSVKRREHNRIKKATLHLLEVKYNKLNKPVKKQKKHGLSPFFQKRTKPPLSQYPLNIKYLANFPDLFSKNQFNQLKNGHLYIPKIFSLIDNHEDSFNFLKRLFVVLNKNKFDELILDYSKCERIDVDASICMDIILAEFILLFNRYRKLGYRNLFDDGISPVHFEKDHIMKVLFSIGAYRNIRGLKLNFHDVEALPVLINDNLKPDVWQRSELDQTEIVEYIKRCSLRLGREITMENETSFYKVIGEVMSNAEEHGSQPNRFAIGFFQEINNSDGHYGIFNFTIFNFGKTIYETFKSPNCLNQKAVQQMSKLSEAYVNNGWFSKSKFEEETLWTLYALQEGVTSKEKKRGNGSIQYIENFFKLKGDMGKDNNSKMVVVSGNTRITFDGTYGIKEKSIEGEKRTFKMITFNDSGEIGDVPDKNFVNFAPHFFPGTLISARILINFVETNDNTNGNQNL